MARTSTTSDVFNAVAEERRRQILDVLRIREATVGELVDHLGIAQPVVSKHLAVLRAVDLVRSTSDGRMRRYRLNGPALRPLHAWLAQYEAAVNARLDRLDDYLAELQQHTKENP